MKKYQFQFSHAAERNFAGLPKPLRKRIFTKLVFWENAEDPLSFGKPVKTRANTFSFRIGDYRLFVIPKSATEFIILLIVKIGHRREVYE